ncbi:xanthine dehydrogenase family protein molybdopterin-binding subunit [Pelagibius litoralis]|uniref:Xanthine dehydrogenase family protein molybdopterin-binding subunit n=1 Tax=Pelagibius litoralis TaxID=374515 RepID=A0A967C4J6_9PROT|nr:xanthine dehydrogenase family protein molybdopterin-binding subunit [Pelagibius litoralis]NIA68650.1 xanthine dehydrogenase family protein molybdopterin-binding subunit [Pelagibius litoralis]
MLAGLKNSATAPVPHESEIPATNRRQFLKASAAVGAGLVIGVVLPQAGNKIAKAAAPAGTAAPVNPNAFVRIAPDSSVTVLIKHIEFGQGTYTGLATLVAEELDADWSQMRAEHAPADATLYNNLHWGPVQGTGGSSSTANSYTQMRQAGAGARALLVLAAADLWGVPAGEITVAKGVVSHAASGNTAGFGELAERAAEMDAPAEVTLKDPADFTLIGKDVPRLDSRAKTRGEAIYTMDKTLPGMLTAVLARPPVFGATLASFDDTAARAVPGVTDVVAVPQGVAVLAEGYWAAKNGRDALDIVWDETTGETRGSAEIMAEYKGLADQPGDMVRSEGAVEEALASAATVLEADYEFPFLAHAPMEPLDCLVQLGPDSCDVWTGSQIPTVDHGAATAISGLKPEQVRVHTLLAGGSFGRRATPNADMVSEAVSVAKAIDGRAPVKVIWTREDDIQGGRYRPMYFQRLRAGLDAEGNLVAWHHRIVGQSIIRNTPFADALIKNGIDQTSVEGANNLPYAIPNMAVDLHTTDVNVPVLWWRAVGSTHTAYSTEAFLDELAEAAGRDPVEFRMAMLKDHPRHAAVLKLAAEKAGWGSPLPEGRSRGVAVHESFASYVAQVAEVSIDGDGQIKVEKVVCAVDCGLAVNPDVVKAQMEGGIGYGLGAILHDAITLDGGRVEQSNFHDYLPLRINEMPEVEVHIVPSAELPTGVGEPGTPPVGPAVANAVYAATGRRIRQLPMALHGLTGA